MPTTPLRHVVLATCCFPVTLPDGTDTVAIRHIGYLGLSWDHRAFDGSTAVLFLARIKQNLESWDWEQELR